MKKIFLVLLLGGLLLPVKVYANTCLYVVGTIYSTSGSQSLYGTSTIVTLDGTQLTSTIQGYAAHPTTTGYFVKPSFRRFQVADGVFSGPLTGGVTSPQFIMQTLEQIKEDNPVIDFVFEETGTSLSQSARDVMIADCAAPPDPECSGGTWNSTTEQCECPEGQRWNETEETCEEIPCTERLGPFYSTTWGDLAYLDNKTVCWPGLEPNCYVTVEIDYVTDFQIVPGSSTDGIPYNISKFSYYVEPMECSDPVQDGVDVSEFPSPDATPLPDEPDLGYKPELPDDPVDEPVAADPDPADPTNPPDEMLGAYLRSIKGDTGSLVKNTNKSNELLNEQLKQQNRDYKIQESQLGELQQIERGLHDVEGAIEGGVDDIEASIDGMAGRLEGAIDGVGSAVDGIGDKLDGMATSEPMPTVPEFDSSLPTDNDYTQFDDPGALAITQADKDKAYYGLLMQESEPDTILGQLAAINPAACLNGAIMNTNVSICFDRPWMLTGYAVMKTVLIGIAYVQSMLLLMKAFQT